MAFIKDLRYVLNEVITERYEDSYETGLSYYFGYINSLKANNIVTECTYNRLFRIYHSLFFSSRIISFRGI